MHQEEPQPAEAKKGESRARTKGAPPSPVLSLRRRRRPCAPRRTTACRSKKVGNGARTKGVPESSSIPCPESASAAEAVQAAGLLHHHYPCLASMGKDPAFGDTLMRLREHLEKHPELEPAS